jgi:hypothetical protein
VDETTSETAAAEPTTTSTLAAPATPSPRTIEASPSAAPVNLLGTVAMPIAKRLAPLLLAALVLGWLLRRARRH